MPTDLFGIDRDDYAQGGLFDLPPAVRPARCHACGAKTCRCAERGHQALELDWPGWEDGSCSECHAPWPECVCPDLCPSSLPHEAPGEYGHAVACPYRYGTPR